ncbi:hypothetical protein [Devosia sp. Leaf420]|uniref:hypothetical protein n=1 Tax=Devosia sp. Leaf420 TaxID=1736374 RepID=UPI000AB8B598|nr:hypothetical protein [Devosia sp. Leaf420]
MQDYVDELSGALTERYKLYLQTFMIDVWNDKRAIGFRFGYSLRHDSKLHTRVFKIGAADAITSAERLAIIDAMFAEIEDHLDETIAASLVELN